MFPPGQARPPCGHYGLAWIAYELSPTLKRGIVRYAIWAPGFAVRRQRVSTPHPPHPSQSFPVSHEEMLLMRPDVAAPLNETFLKLYRFADSKRLETRGILRKNPIRPPVTVGWVGNTLIKWGSGARTRVLRVRHPPWGKKIGVDSKRRENMGRDGILERANRPELNGDRTSYHYKSCPLAYVPRALLRGSLLLPGGWQWGGAGGFFRLAGVRARGLGTRQETAQVTAHGPCFFQG